ncbi:MAG TPA: four helix bundle protein [Anaerolineae bacterium]|nr:four helix bundle protein [Anaerolineae bacterium]
MAEYQYRGKDTQTFQKLHGFKKIVAWQAASDLGFQVNQLAKRFGPGYYKLADQMRTAAISVSGNIAEGYCSGSLPNYIRYCNVARGSLGELGSYIQDCERWELITGSELTTLIKQYSDASFFLDRLIPALIRKQQDDTWDQNYWVKEEQADYLMDIEYDTEFPEFPQVP